MESIITQTTSDKDSSSTSGKTSTLPAALLKCGPVGFLENRLVQWLFVLSCVATSAAVVKPSVISFACNAFVFAVAYFLTFRRKILVHVFRQWNGIIVAFATVTTLVAVGSNVKVFFLRIVADNPGLPTKLGAAVGFSDSSHVQFTCVVLFFIYLVTAPAMFVFLYAYLAILCNFITKLFQTSDQPERMFFIAAFLVSAVSVWIVYHSTTAFVEPSCVSMKSNELIRPDCEVVYTFDSAIHYRYYSYRAVLHRSLSSLLFLPFLTLTWIGHIPFSFLKEQVSLLAAHSLICIVQLPLLVIHPILLSRLVGVKGWSKTIFLILFALSYPALLFALTFEGYVIMTFFTTVLIYYLLTEKPNHWNTCFAYAAAAGSLLSTGIMVLFFARLKSMKEDICNMFRALFVFVTILLFYDAGFLKGIGTSTDYYARYTGMTFTLYDKVLQYINFIAACFFKPATIIDFPRLDFGDSQWLAYILADVRSVNPLGLVFFAFCILGFILNYKDKFAQICAFWIAFSFFIMCLVGWGTAENGLILYALYFGWAYFCLAFLAIEKSLKKLPTMKYAVYVAIIAIFAWINLPGIYDLIQFGIEYYPVQ